MRLTSGEPVSGAVLADCQKRFVTAGCTRDWRLGIRSLLAAGGLTEDLRQRDVDA